jgi:tungstate transport system substrate-binding protein
LTGKRRASAPRCPAGASPCRRGIALLLTVLLSSACSRAEPITLASTTSTEDSGLFDVLLPAFQRAHPQYRIQLIAVGTGQALALGARGDADVLLVHAPEAELAFMGAGHGTRRRPVMHNRFVLLTPEGDPAAISAAADACDAMRRIASVRAPFVSRGDDSGTHKRERALWRCAGVSPAPPWYLDVGQGMTETLAIAAERGAYTLSDDATFMMLAPEGLAVAASDDPQLRNEYSVIEVRGAAHAAGARVFADWLTNEGKRVIGAYGEEQFGRPLFTPDS